MCGGTCHLSSFKTVFWEPYFPWEQFVYYLINIVNVKILSLTSSPQLPSAPLILFVVLNWALCVTPDLGNPLAVTDFCLVPYIFAAISGTTISFRMNQVLSCLILNKCFGFTEKRLLCFCFCFFLFHSAVNFPSFSLHKWYEFSGLSAVGGESWEITAG